jgi:hypothetical protein
MIIVKLIGGLGNQLFQYALGRHLAHIHKTELKLDVTGFEAYKLHSYGLGKFNIVENFATKEEIKRFIKYRKKNGRIWFLYNRLIADKSMYVQERQFNFDPSVLRSKNSAYIDGFWQTEKYFKAIEEIIRKEFTLKTKISDYSAQIASCINNANSVSIHIRRGDYASDEKTNKYHGLCSLDYYHEAIKEIAKKIDKPHFFIFSDEPEWAKKNLILDFPATYVDGNKSDKNYEDLYLMSLCKHQIIANSSFSWWGAWLNQNKNKIVFAPKKWFSYTKTSVNTNDIIPDSWIKI